MTSDSRIYFMLMTMIACAFIVFGFTGDGYLHKASILFGGVYLGNVITEALNYDETNTTKEA